MISTCQDERKGFFLFILLVLMTAGCFALLSSSFFVLGGLSVLWGAFGFLRLFYFVSEDDSRFARIFNLPGQLLFGLDKARGKAKNAIVYRLSQWDVVLWGAMAFSLLCWFLISSVTPASIPLIDDLHSQQSVLSGFKAFSAINMYSIVTELLVFIIIGMMSILAISYARNERTVLFISYTRLFTFVAGIIVAFFHADMTENAHWPSFSNLKGGGLGQSELVYLLAPDFMNQVASGLYVRFLEGGFIGAYGTYVLYILVMYILCRSILFRSKDFFELANAVLILLVVMALDMFWVSTGLIQALIFIGLAFVALCWGAAGKYQHETS